MKNLLAAAFATLLLASAAHAADMSFPSDDPVATISIPDSWGPKETDTGIDMTSDDDSIYMSIDVADPKDLETTITDAIKYLADQGVTVDQSTAKTTKGTLNGMASNNVDWDGTDKDGPVSISLAALAANDKVLVVTYWGTKGQQEKNGPALMAIINSLKPVAK